MDKKLLTAILLSLGTVWLFNYYFSSKPASITQGGAVQVGSHEIAPGKPVQVAATEVLYKPLHLDVGFADKKSGVEQLVAVDTPHVHAVFSTNGGALSTLDFKDFQGKNKTALRTVYTKGAFENEQREQTAFLVAFDKQTPYAYTFEGTHAANGVTEVAFKAAGDLCTVYKTYKMYDDSFKCDLSITVEPHTVDGVTPRLMVPAPYLHELGEDTLSVVAWDEQRQSVEKQELAASTRMAWFWLEKKPLFGIEDRYFAHALTADTNGFVQRAYVKKFNVGAASIFEGPTITQKTSWNLSFYLGPKRYQQLHDVDERLTDLMSFGWLSTLCKLLLRFLDFLYSLIGNFGWAIIIMTILLRLPFIPLFIRGRRKMEVFQRYQPAINHIRTKYRHDSAMMQQEMMRFFQEHGISPTMQFSAMLPQILTMPILFALYRVLNNYIDLYQAPFGPWIHDLSAKDPFYILPIIMCLSMIWQQSLAPVSDEKQRIPMLFFSVVVAVIFANFPAGLVLYWLMNNLLAIAEDYYRKIFARK